MFGELYLDAYPVATISWIAEHSGRTEVYVAQSLSSMTKTHNDQVRIPGDFENRRMFVGGRHKNQLLVVAHICAIQQDSRGCCCASISGEK